jgi:dTDP-4-dehydrorhamnose reductase
MKVLITGADGQLGTDLCKVLKGHHLITLTINDGDISDFSFVKKQIFKLKPEVIINTAAYVRVDDCEDNKDLAFQVNALGARNVAVAAEDTGARLLHISTDYVFGGEKEPRNKPYTEFDDPVPGNLYGESKLAGEVLVRRLCRRHIIVRSSALFGTAGAMGKGGNFVETICRLGKEKEELRVVSDQVFSPTFTYDLALRISQLIETEYYGIFHVTNSGICSWHEFATEIIREAGLKTPVIPISTAQYPQKARRPAYSVLDNYQAKLLNWTEMRSWKAALHEYFKQKQAAG